MFEASLTINERLAAQLGVPPATAVSTRDVPGWTRAAIPLLHKHGINGMSFGSGTPPGRPEGMPQLFVWRDEQSGAEVVVTTESGYGGIGYLFVLPSGVALAPNWTGDNSGPAGIGGTLAALQQRYPNATVKPTTLSAFFNEANKPSNKAALSATPPPSPFLPSSSFYTFSFFLYWSTRGCPHTPFFFLVTNSLLSRAGSTLPRFLC